MLKYDWVHGRGQGPMSVDRLANGRSQGVHRTFRLPNEKMLFVQPPAFDFWLGAEDTYPVLLSRAAKQLLQAQGKLDSPSAVCPSPLCHS